MRRRTACILVLGLIAICAPAAAQLSSAWVVPAVANTGGENDTYWRSDLSIHNPHEYELVIVLQFLPSDTSNWSALAYDITLGPWQSINLWDVLGPDFFDETGTGALLMYVDLANPCSDPGSCDFLATSRTYTPDPLSDDGEFGQAIPGFTADNGTDWATYGYTAGILNDGWYFRTNVGAMSWSDEWVAVNIDVQDEDGNIVATEYLDIPPFGHVQKRLDTEISGASLVYYIVDGPDDALIFPYASIVNEVTGDPSFNFAFASSVGPVIPGKRSSAASSHSVRERSYPAIAGQPRILNQSKTRR